jgi:rhodanese-related sulfurtransferase
MSMAAWKPGRIPAYRSRNRHNQKAAEIVKTLVSEAGETPEVDVAEAVRATADDGAVLLDIREPREWARWRIPGAVHIPMGDLAQRAGELDRSKPIVVYCKSGQRSLVSTDELLGLGFRDVASLNGGIIAWAEAEEPIEE